MAHQNAATRTEHDSLGPVDVPALALWGAQTERSRQLFAIGQQRMPLAVVHALAEIKCAAAQANAALGLLAPERAEVIAAAARRVAAGELDGEFPLSVWQTGSGTQTNMNVNEVIAHVASLAMGGCLGSARCVHPNDEVNLGQSSNDAFPTAMHLAAVAAMRPLLGAMGQLRSALQAKAAAWQSEIKTGRTHLQDATPVTLGQEFTAYDAQLAHAEHALQSALPGVQALAIGGTAVGNGLNTHPAFGTRVVQLLSRQRGEPFSLADSALAATAGHEALVILHAALRSLAISLIKIANDIRLMGSGPRAGLGELRLPANEPGSSIMPGKVNPTQIEALCMVCAQVMGHDVAIGLAASQGQFELNVHKPLIVLNLLDSLGLLTDAMRSFTTHCVQGLRANTAHLQTTLSHTLMLATALVPHIGYDRTAQVARHADQQGLSLREAALAVAQVSHADFDAWVDARRMLGPRSAEALV